MSDAPPDWSQDDPSQPDYIKNKPELVAGENIALTKIGNKVIISATGEYPDTPDEPDIPDEPDTPDTPDTPDDPVVPSGTPIETIIENSLPVYVTIDGVTEEKEFVLLNNGSSYAEEGLYVSSDGTAAMYQVVFEPSAKELPQSICILKDANIINTYQYQVGLGQWYPMGVDGTYWLVGGEVTKTVNGQEFIYTEYVYNAELWGEPIMTTEYWRFEVEV